MHLSEIWHSKKNDSRLSRTQVINKGKTLTANNITIKRAGSGIPAAHWDMIIGTKALHDFDIDEPIKID